MRTQVSSSPNDTETAAKDARDLATFGYKQELARRLGSFSAFAAGFSYISILTGMFQMFHLGFAAGGPAFFWTWPLVFAGQFLVALCFAELAAHYPLSGGVYQWSKYLGSPALGWIAGWIYLACLIITLAAVALALQTSLPQISERFQILGDCSRELDRARNAVLLGCLLIAFSTVINSVGIKVLARINNVGVFSEIVGVVLLVILLARHAIRSPAAALVDTAGLGAGKPLGYLGPFLAATGLTASYVLYGYDTAGSLAEETADPRRKAPRAILQALSAAAAAGALLLLFALLAAGDLRAPELAADNGGLPYIVKQALGDNLGKVFLWDVILAITVCTLACHTGAVRLIFAMARDGNLPFSTALARVSPGSRVPIVPAVLAGALAVAILLLNVDFPNVIKVVTSVAILWANLAYLLVTAALLWRRWRDWPLAESAATGAFALGRWGLPINQLAVAWCLFTVVNVGWPRADVYGEEWYHRYGAMLYTTGLALAGGCYYLAMRRHPKPILPEHSTKPWAAEQSRLPS
jgi:urea carboxylase system permease